MKAADIIEVLKEDPSVEVELYVNTPEGMQRMVVVAVEPAEAPDKRYPGTRSMRVLFGKWMS